MQAGAQAADRFNRRVGRRIDRQQVQAALRAAAAAPTAPTALAALQQVLGRAQRNDRVHRQAQLLDLRGIFHARVHDPAQEHQTHRQEGAQQGADQHHQRPARLHRMGHIHRGSVDDADVADSAGAGHVQLLGLVEQRGVQLVADLQVAAQAQQFLLGVWQFADLPIEAGLAAFQLGDLLEQRAVGRVFTGEAAIHFGLLHVQLLDAGLDRDLLLQQALGLHGDVDRLGLGLVGVHRRLRRLDLAAHDRQLLPDETQLRGGFGRIAVHVLAHIGLGHFLQEPASQVGVLVLIAQLQDAGLLALLGRLDLPLQRGDHVQATLPGDTEMGAGVGGQRLDQQGHLVPAGLFADLTLKQDLAFFVKQGVPARRIAHFKGHRRTKHGLGHRQPGDRKTLSTPAVAVQAEQGRGDRAFGLRLEPPRKEIPQQRQPLGRDLRVQLQLIHRLAHHRARGDQRHFGGRRRTGPVHPQRGQVGQAGNRGHLGFDLDHGLGLVHRRCEQRVGDTDHEEQPGNARNQPFVVQQHAHQFAQVDLIFILCGVGTQVVAHSGCSLLDKKNYRR